MKRRHLVSMLALAPWMLPSSFANTRATLEELYGTRPISDGRVDLLTPALAENGHSVSLRVEVASPMNETDYVREITVIAGVNPVPRIARYRFSPASGIAAVETRVRLADSQVITAIAEMSDGSLWRGTSTTIVTLAACVEPLL